MEPEILNLSKKKVLISLLIVTWNLQDLKTLLRIILIEQLLGYLMLKLYLWNLVQKVFSIGNILMNLKL